MLERRFAKLPSAKPFFGCHIRRISHVVGNKHLWPVGLYFTSTGTEGRGADLLNASPDLRTIEKRSNRGYCGFGSALRGSYIHFSFHLGEERRTTGFNGLGFSESRNAANPSQSSRIFVQSSYHHGVSDQFCYCCLAGKSYSVCLHKLWLQHCQVSVVRRFHKLSSKNQCPDYPIRDDNEPYFAHHRWRGYHR